MKDKSAAAYTIKWLNRNKQHWHEIDYFGRTKIIIIDKPDAPKIVLKRVGEINDARVGVKWVKKEMRAMQNRKWPFLFLKIKKRHPQRGCLMQIPRRYPRKY